MTRLEDIRQEPIWITKDGRCVAVSRMTDKHLRNACRMLVKHCEIMWPFRIWYREEILFRVHWIKIFFEEGKKRKLQLETSFKWRN